MQLKHNIPHSAGATNIIYVLRVALATNRRDPAPGRGHRTLRTATPGDIDSRPLDQFGH
ncbi:hypothetical protein AB0F81_17000 [Actinoplanes sp. NPDC024001]|uniref:hypothetical protein n=1 Tax=Actinoplanes sp. NPDC024001 TaxID=3154598 RepID=UPI0033DAE642